MVADGEMISRRGRGGRRRGADAPDPATDGSADAERRERQSALRRLLRRDFPERRRDALLPILHLLQGEHGYLPEWALQVVGWHLRVPASEVYGAATSYSELRTAAPAAHAVTVCTGLACWLAGGEELLAATRTLLSNRHDCSVDATACAFLCGVAPAAGIDGQWQGRVDARRLLASLSEDALSEDAE